VERADGTRQVLPSKCHDVRVDPGDVLHFVTWGGGGWGDPLERDPALVALEVDRGLVTAEGARRYGVVLGPDGDRPTVDDEATRELRERMRADRPAELPVFDMGPPIEELLARCEEETGLPAPKRPVWT
jgi:N-methylhydantoinase B